MFAQTFPEKAIFFGGGVAFFHLSTGPPLFWHQESMSSPAELLGPGYYFVLFVWLFCVFFLFFVVVVVVVVVAFCCGGSRFPLKKDAETAFFFAALLKRHNFAPGFFWLLVRGNVRGLLLHKLSV